MSHVLCKTKTKQLLSKLEQFFTLSPEMFPQGLYNRREYNLDTLHGGQFCKIFLTQQFHLQRFTLPYTYMCEIMAV